MKLTLSPNMHSVSLCRFPPKQTGHKRRPCVLICKMSVTYDVGFSEHTDTRGAALASALGLSASLGYRIH